MFVGQARSSSLTPHPSKSWLSARLTGGSYEIGFGTSRSVVCGLGGVSDAEIGHEIKMKQGNDEYRVGTKCQ
jgi:hypothetical protein